MNKQEPLHPDAYGDELNLFARVNVLQEIPLGVHKKLYTVITFSLDGKAALINYGQTIAKWEKTKNLVLVYNV